VTRERRVKKKKPAATREQVYAFAHGCIERGFPKPAAAAVICFEWLQRPENVLAGISAGRITAVRSAGVAANDPKRSPLVAQSGHACQRPPRQLLG
jgi:hypothetical protein